MRILFLASTSAVLLSACLTTQENPNYEHSTVYRGDPVQTTQYASSVPAATTAVNYEPAPIQYESATVSYDQPTTYENAPVYAHNAPEVPPLPSSFGETVPVAAPVTTYATATAPAPTDTAYNNTTQEITGTPGFMALQSQQHASAAQVELAPQLPEIQAVPHARLRAAGTPVPYDYSRNLITADAITTGQQIPDTVRILQGGSQSYIVQPGDTVYSLSRKTCVGVNVIQSMNGLGADYGINIGQSIQLPTSVC